MRLLLVEDAKVEGPNSDADDYLGKPYAISDAVKYNLPGGSITITAWQLDSQTSVFVSGSGVGLNIVKQICNLHHLSVNLESAPNHGTTVTINGLNSYIK